MVAMAKDTDKIKKALFDKAIGYTAEEVTEEYGMVDSELVLLKKKRSFKSYPPDISAITMLLEKDKSMYEDLTDEELALEKARLLKLLNKEK